MFCTKCGFSLPDDANFCAACGAKTLAAGGPAQRVERESPAELPAPSPREWPFVIRDGPHVPPPVVAAVVAPVGVAVPQVGRAEPAGFGPRVSAAIVDGGIWIAVIMASIAVLFPAPAFESTLTLSAFGFATPVWWWIYSAGYISSAKQATPGMAMAGIAATDLAGERLSFGRASARCVVKLATIVAFPCLIASMVTILRSAKRQALHDLASGSLVLQVARPHEAPAHRASTGHLSLRADDVAPPQSPAFPLSRAAIWALCVFATPVVGAILYYAWRRSHPDAARYANIASFVVFGVWFLLWLASRFALSGGLL